MPCSWYKKISPTWEVPAVWVLSSTHTVGIDKGSNVFHLCLKHGLRLTIKDNVQKVEK